MWFFHRHGYRHGYPRISCRSRIIFGMLLIWKEIFRLASVSTWCIRESPVAVALSGPTSRGSIRNQRARFNDFAPISRHVLSLKAFPCHDAEQSSQNLSGNRTGKSGADLFSQVPRACLVVKESGVSTKVNAVKAVVNYGPFKAKHGRHKDYSLCLLNIYTGGISMLFEWFERCATNSHDCQLISWLSNEVGNSNGPTVPNQTWSQVAEIFCRSLG